MNNYLNFYRDYTFEIEEKSYPKSLLKFLRSYCSDYSYKSIIELGCGNIPLISQEEIKEYFGLDISTDAISRNRFEYGEDNFMSGNITHNLELNRKFNIILDSHLLHCLALKQDRINYFQNVKSIMDENSFFLGEVICFDKDVRIPFDYMFDGEAIFKMDHQLSSQYFKDGMFPYRMFLDIRDIEKEFIENNFKIDFFMVRKDLRLNLFPKDNFSDKYSPYLCQFALKLKPEDFTEKS